MSNPIIFRLNKELDKKICLDFLDIKVSGVNFGQGIIKMYPQLKTARGENQNLRQKIISLFVDRYYQNHQQEMKKVLAKTKTNWEEIDQKFYKEVESIFENHPWPCGRYTAYLSIFDINPRFLETKTFQIFYLKTADEILNTIVHEMLHFMFYDYLDKIVQSSKSFSEKTVWDLAELFNTVILSQDKFKRLKAGSDFCYPELLRHLPKIKNYWLVRKNLKSFIRESLKYLMAVVDHTSSIRRV